VGQCARSYITDNTGVNGDKIPVGGTVGCLYDTSGTTIMPTATCPDP
jgi:hypothetical protein